MANKIRSHPRGPVGRRVPPSQPDPPYSAGVWRATLSYVFTGLVLSYPLSSAMLSQGPFGEAEARENAWILSWVSHQLLTHPLALFDAHSYHPLSNTLAFTEHLFVPSLLASPILYVSNDLVLTYNVTLLVCIVTTALGMYLLAITLTRNHLAALLAGIFFVFVPYRFSHLHHLQLQLYAFLPLALACLHRYMDTDNRHWAWCYAGCIVAQCLCGSQLAAVALFATALTLPVVLTTIRSTRQLYVLATAVVLALVTLYPFYTPYLEVRRAGLTQPLNATTEVRSATPESFMASSSLLYRRMNTTSLDPHGVDERLFPGVTLVGLGAFGWVLLITRTSRAYRPRFLAVSYGLLLLCGVVLSLGAHTPVYRWLFDAVPIVATIRDVTPFSLLMLMSLSVCSGLAMAWIFEGPGKAQQRSIASGLAVVFILESIAMPYNIETFQDRPPEAFLWLASAAVPGAIVELPYETTNDGELFYARHHGFRPTLNGAGSLIPPSHRLLERLFEQFPSEESILVLERLDVRYVIVHMDRYSPRRLVRLLNDLARDRHRLMPIRDFGDDLVYEVVSRSSTHQAASAAGVVLSSVESIPQVASHSETLIEVHLSTASTVTGLRIHYGPNPIRPAIEVEVSTPDEHNEWRMLWCSPSQWPARSQLVLALIENPSNGFQQLSFSPAEARRLQILLRGQEAPPTIHRLEILGPSGPN